MMCTCARLLTALSLAGATAVVIVAPVRVHAQYGEPRPTQYLFAQAPPAQGATVQVPKAVAPIDLTGYWVSLVTDDWRWRMVTPPKGDAMYLPMNAEGRKVTDAWDPEKDEAAGEQCRGYGAAAVMRLPGRLHITWDNDTTLKVETDAGTQTRMFEFGAIRPTTDTSFVSAAPALALAQQPSEASWQGISVAQWEYDGAVRRRGPQTTPKFGSLKVVTTRMRPGYIRKNGVPYSGNAVLTEYFARITEPNGDDYLMVTNFLDDPQYLNGPFVRSVQFRRQKDATGWNPTPCSAR